MESTRTTNASARGETSEAHDDRRQRALKERGELPAHVACIMDGNGRWAQQRGESRVMGHHEGVTSVRDVTEASAELGIDYLTLYTFSTENWERPDSEVDALMELLVRTVQKERSTLMENEVQLQTIGDLSQLPGSCEEALVQTKNDTVENDRMTLTLALSYSGRWEILQAARDLATRVQEGDLAPEDIDASRFERQLDTEGMPDPDLLVRTGGEYRLSNFLLWQSAYTELYITDDYWPDFRREQLYGAIRSYQERDRRFGRVESNAPDENANGA
ncbi:MAG: di-trans,poly-cis-decaprenylcistransferase [Bacteroidetes bacterium QH_10_64_37]|jgi:undecaprenyl diphosphate synthase|nr:MAG: di-trans,poly-cis-decaprenylcistransferase [Bacteroidetes bacterium QH_10_64_37]